jgi:hypothetical protein
MKKILLGILIMLSSVLQAQVWLRQNFNFDTFPPDGWSIDQHANNWKRTLTNYAGGVPGEATLKTDPAFTDTTRLISPVMDISGAENLYISFKYTLKLFQGGIVIGIAIRAEGGDWVSVWEIDGHSTDHVWMDIPLGESGDISGMQICIYYGGSSGKLKFWAIDDITVYTKKEHDLAARNVVTDTYFDPSEEINPGVKIYNNGLNAETFDVYCRIFNTGNEILYSGTQPVDTLNAGSSKTLTFDPFTLPADPDEAYHLVINTSLEGDFNPDNDTVKAYVYTYASYPHDMVVLEIGTATWCSACPYAAEAADSIMKNGYNLAVIEYHTSDEYTTEESNNRALDYYAMFGFPTAYFDGVTEQVGAGPNFYSQYFGYYYQRSLVKTGTSITMSADKERDSYLIHVRISKLAPVFNPHVTVHFVVTESHIPEEWEGETELNDVCRLMLPDENGTSINLAGQDEILLDYTVTPDTSWNFDELVVIAFVQDNDSREILNAVKSPLAALSGTTEHNNFTALSMTNYPNPFSRETKFGFMLQDNTHVTLQVFDMTGKLIAQLINSVQTKGIHEITWKADNLPGGIYLAKLTAGNRVMVKKICKRNN